jgi:hypothetical protein
VKSLAKVPLPDSPQPLLAEPKTDTEVPAGRPAKWLMHGGGQRTGVRMDSYVVEKKESVSISPEATRAFVSV